MVILVVIIIWLSISVWGVYRKQDMTKDNLLKTTVSLNNLKNREKMLTAEIESLKTNTGKEEEIREKYGLVKAGEEVIVVVDKDDNIDSVAEPLKVGFWEKIWGWFR